MRWERLVTDLDGAAAERERWSREAEVADRVRRELAKVELSDRIRAHEGPLEMLLRAGKKVRGNVVDAGLDWVILQDREQILVPLAAIMEINGLGRSVAAPTDVRRRMTLAHAMRALSRHCIPVTIEDDLRRLRSGIIDSVGADFLELGVHASGRPRRTRRIETIRVIPFSAIVSLTTHFDQFVPSTGPSSSSSWDAFR